MSDKTFKMDGRNLYFCDFTFFVKVYIVDYFIVEIRNDDADISTNIHYYLFLITDIFYRCINGNLKICLYTHLPIKSIPKVSRIALFSFWDMLIFEM